MSRMAMRSGVSRALARRPGSSPGAAVKLAGAAVPVRHMETHTSTGSTGTIAHSTEAEVLKSLVGGMMHHARGFPIKGDSVEILETPSQFYNALLQGARNARSRVVIASLYIGTGSLEQELVGSKTTIIRVAREETFSAGNNSLRCVTHNAAVAGIERVPFERGHAIKHPSLRQSSLAEVQGSPQGSRASCTVPNPDAEPVIEDGPPARVQEIVGVCHLKAFIFDDTVIMTGANLSTSYFTVRQDRYLCFPDCKNLASHFCSLINTVALYSYTLDDMGRLQPRSAHLDPVREPELFCTELSDSVNDLTTPVKGAHAVEGADTWVFPTVQMGPLGIRQDEAAMLWLLKQLPGCSDVHLSSPYFNLTPEYENAMLEAARDKRVHILTASPQANGFYGSSGISGFIPLAYSLLEQQLHNRAMSTDDKHKSSPPKRGLSIYEYERLGWTFHAKGLWCSLPGAEEGPSVSLVGSSNLGYRSRDRDLEAQVCLFTNAPRLQQQLERERDDLFVRASKVNSSIFRGPGRQGGLFASLALKLIKPWL